MRCTARDGGDRDVQFLKLETAMAESSHCREYVPRLSWLAKDIPLKPHQYFLDVEK